MAKIQQDNEQPLDYVAACAAAAEEERRARSRRVVKPAIPQYVGLRVAALLLLIFSILSYLGGIGFIIGALAATNGDASRFENGLLVKSNLEMASMSIFSGAILQAISAGSAAIRDLAQNSFYWRK